MFWAIDTDKNRFVFQTIDDLFDFIAIRGEANIVEGWAGI